MQCTPTIGSKNPPVLKGLWLHWKRERWGCWWLVNPLLTISAVIQLDTELIVDSLKEGSITLCTNQLSLRAVRWFVQRHTTVNLTSDPGLLLFDGKFSYAYRNCRLQFSDLHTFCILGQHSPDPFHRSTDVIKIFIKHHHPMHTHAYTLRQICRCREDKPGI